MAASDSRNSHSISTPNRIAKDVQGPDNPIPLSPQWLLPKPGENKSGMVPGDNHVSPFAGNGNRSDAIKSPRNGEDMHEGQKKKDVFRPTFLDMESDRRDSWRDEERDPNPSIRRDRWREGDKEIGDNRKTDRWVDNSSTRHFGETRRVPADRLADPNREINYDQRHESKWNTRWGPNDRDMDKWTDAGKHGEMPLDKPLSHLTSQGKDEKEGDHYRPWRPSSLQSRGKVEPPHHQTQLASKGGPTFGHGRGRGENVPSTFSVGRGRASFGSGSSNNNSAHPQSLGFISSRGDNGHGEAPFKYSRTKLLDIYRLTDIRSSNKILDELIQFPSLTNEEPLEPLALCAPTSEESAIFKGIDKGDIVSSGAPQTSKDGSSVRSSMDFVQSRRPKLGSRDDVSLLVGDVNDKVDNSQGAYSKFSDGLSHEKQVNAYGSNVTMEGMENQHMYSENKYNIEATARDNGTALRKADDVSSKRDTSIKGSVTAQSGTPWRSPSVGGHARTTSRDLCDITSDVRTRNADVGWSEALKDHSSEWKNGLPDACHATNELKWQINEDSMGRKHHSSVVDREQESRKLLQPSPEDLLLYYKDPQGQIQGPFSGSDIIGWFEAGYFGIDLQVRLANAPNDSPFSLLGDVMPHLRAKARPPPGFNTGKQSEVADVSSRPSLSGFGKVLSVPGGIDLIGNEQRHAHGSSTEAENRFLESLMSGDISSSPLERFASSEGLQGFTGPTSSIMPPLGMESVDALNLLAKRMNLERQKSLPHPYPYWPARDAAPVVPSPDILRDSSVLQANLLSSIADVPRQSHPQNVDMMSILQGLSDRSSVSMNNGVGGWSKFSALGGGDPFKDKIDTHHGQSFPQEVYGMQQHNLQPQNQPSITNLLAQTVDSPSILTDKLLSSRLVQDPQVLNLLQQQCLLQLQSQQSVPGVQLSLMDKILLLKQQQKQQEQQQLLQQQQQLLSQVLSEHHLAQRFGDPSYGQLQASAIPGGNAPTDHSVSQLSHQLLPTSSQVPVSGIPDDRNVNFVNMPPKVPQDSSPIASEGSPLHLPHQIVGVPQKSWPSMTTHNDNFKHIDSSLGPLMVEKLAGSKVMEKFQEAYELEHSIASEFSGKTSVGPASQDNSVTVEPTTVPAPGVSDNPVTSELSEPSKCKPSVRAQDDESLMPGRTNDAKVVSTHVHEETPVKECKEEVPAVKEAKNAEVREVKKTSEKKSKKQKSSKVQPSSDQAKGASKASASQQSKPSEAEGANVADKSRVTVAAGGTTVEISLEKVNEISDTHENDHSVSASLPGGDFECTEAKDEQKQSVSVTQQSAQVNSGQKAWKPAVSVKPKSLLEIQQEEQRRVQMESPVSAISASVSSVSSPTPWAGVLAHAEPKLSREIHQDSRNSEFNMGKSDLSKSKRSGLHDLLAEEVLAKSNDRDIVVSDIALSLLPLPTVSSRMDTVDDDNFIEAKDTKKSRKKAAKAKGTGAKVLASNSSAEVIVASCPVEKGNSSKHVQTEKEVLPAPPSGPSLGDFVPWKGESTSPSLAPAWSADSGKLHRPTSLRDILREQEKKVTSAQQHSQMPTPQKSQSAQTRAGLWSVTASSPSKATSPIQISSHVSSLSKAKGEDDLFWGPPDQSKQETKQVEFPQLGNHGSWATKTTPGKAAPGASRQKYAGGRVVEHHLSSSAASPQSSLKGKREGSTKHSEAMDFRDWCEGESVRLTGSKDTSFLEFCVKQSRSEAETLLIENLGTFDPNHEFIEKFLNYMQLLPADVLEIAFQSRNDLKASKTGARDMTSDISGFGDTDRENGADGSAKGGKKKGKKGKKVSPSVLGFSVVSNRIMMGEIQAVED